MPKSISRAFSATPTASESGFFNPITRATASESGFSYPITRAADRVEVQGIRGIGIAPLQSQSQNVAKVFTGKTGLLSEKVMPIRT